MTKDAAQLGMLASMKNTFPFPRRDRQKPLNKHSSFLRRESESKTGEVSGKTSVNHTGDPKPR